MPESVISTNEIVISGVLCTGRPVCPREILAIMPNVIIDMAPVVNACRTMYEEMLGTTTDKASRIKLTTIQP
jgi:hypothetical protein